MKIKMVLGAIIVLAITLIGGNTMALSKLTTELNTISELDTVIRNQATTVKAAFDHDVNVVKDYINNTLTAKQIPHLKQKPI